MLVQADTLQRTEFFLNTIENNYQTFQNLLWCNMFVFFIPASLAFSMFRVKLILWSQGIIRFIY